MRKYNKNTNELEAAVCNCCGKSMKIQNGMQLEGICSVDTLWWFFFVLVLFFFVFGMLLEGSCSVDTTWGYFSGKDLEKHEFDLCEECYDRITLSFAVPPEISEDTEV